MTTTKASRTIRRRAHRAVLGRGLGLIVGAIIVEMCLASPGHAQPSTTTSCVFVGNNGPMGATAGRIDAFLSVQGTLTPVVSSTSVPQGGVQKMLLRDHTLLALTSTALLSFDINAFCGLTPRSTVAVDSTPDMALGDAAVYVSSNSSTSTMNPVISVAIDWDGNLSNPVAPPGSGSADGPLSIAAATPMVYSLGHNLCQFPVQPGGTLSTPACGTSFPPDPRIPLLVAGNVLYELQRVSEALTAARIDPATGNLTFVDAVPPTIAFDALQLRPGPLAMAAWPDGSVVFVSGRDGIESVSAPTSTQPHAVVSFAPVVSNANAIATDPQFPFLYATAPAQGKVFSIPVSGGFALQSNVTSTPVADQPLSVAAWRVCAYLSPAQACGGRTCGTAFDGCGGWVNCGSSCCTVAQACGSNVCGTASDGCGRELSCGSCGVGKTCNLGTCIPKCAQGQVFCNGHCTRPTYCQ
jgi:hypothetical protein